MGLGRRAGGAGWFWRLGGSRGGREDGEGGRKSRRWRPSWRLRFGSVFSASAWRWRRADVGFSFVDRVVFHLLYLVEAVVLVAVFCFYFCRFGFRV